MGMEYRISFPVRLAEVVHAELDRMDGTLRENVYDFFDEGGVHYASVGVEQDGLYFLDNCGLRKPVADLFYRLIRVALSHSPSVTIVEL
jgi:hypothetical protein